MFQWTNRLMGRRENLPTIATRAAVAFIGAFGLMNIVGEWVCPGFDANLWWVDWRPLGNFVGPGLIAVACGLMLGFALRPQMRRWRLAATRVTTGALLLLAVIDSARFYRLLIVRRIVSSFPVPFSLLVAAGLAWALLGLRRRGPATEPAPRASLPRQLAFAAAFVIYLGVFMVAQMVCFGKTDYRAKGADAIVVLGAGVRPDGSCSDALHDRVVTACRLYREGYAPRLIFSGGQGSGPVHETAAMTTLALSHGVPAEAILCDDEGVNTQATVDHTIPILRRLGARPDHVLVISHFYHLPRVKMAYQRAGWDIRTVPAEQAWPLRELPYYMAREAIALWAYYLRPLAGR